MNDQNRLRLLFLVRSSQVRIWRHFHALWMVVCHSSSVLVIIINIVRCYTVVVCEMLWPKVFTKITTVLMDLKSLDEFFFGKSYCVLSVCTIYFLNINGSGNLFSRHRNSVLFQCTTLARWCVSELWKWQSNFFTFYMYLYV